MKKNNHNHYRAMTLQSLIARQLMKYLLFALVIMFFFHLIFSLRWNPLYNQYYDKLGPNPVFYQTDLKDFRSISEEYLLEYNASIEVLDGDLRVIYAKGKFDQQREQYSTNEFIDLLAMEHPQQMMRTDRYTAQDGTRYTIILRQQLDFDLMISLEKIARLNATLQVLGSLFILIITIMFCARSIYKHIQKNLYLVSSSIAKTPHDVSRVDMSKASLVEIQVIIKEYNTMLDKMQQITQEKNQLEEERHRLISNLSHDLKSPMTTLKGYAEVLMDTELTLEEEKKYLGYIYHNVTALNSMVELLFEQVKFQYNDYTLRLEHKDMNSFIRDICANYYMRFDQLGFTVNVEIMEEPYYMDFDLINMRRVYSNLLENIMGHNPVPTEVLIATALRDDCYLIQVKDNGTGIAVEDRQKVFEPMYQGDISRTKQHSGLGLFVVKQILEKHGGRIILSSEPSYKTVFTIYFPRDEHQ